MGRVNGIPPGQQLPVESPKGLGRAALVRLLPSPIWLMTAWLAACPVGRTPGHWRWKGVRAWGSGYSLKALYIDSSSSRERLFLWTSAFSSMLARTCVAAKYVGRRAQSAGLACNNFRAAAFCVDNCPVVPKMCPGLSTAAPPGCVRWLVPWPCMALPPADCPRKNPAFFAESRVIWVWQGGLEPPSGGRLQGMLPRPRAIPYLAGAGAGPGRPSPPRMPPMGRPRWAWASKVFCCSGASVA